MKEKSPVASSKLNPVLSEEACAPLSDDPAAVLSALFPAAGLPNTGITKVVSKSTTEIAAIK